MVIGEGKKYKEIISFENFYILFFSLNKFTHNRIII